MRGIDFVYMILLSLLAILKVGLIVWGSAKSLENKKLEDNKIITGLTAENIFKNLEPFGFTFIGNKTSEYNSEWNPFYSLIGSATIKRGSIEIKVLCHVSAFSKKEIISINLIVTTPPFANSAERAVIEGEVLGIMKCVAKMPIKGVNNSRLGEWVENEIKHPTKNETPEFYAENSILYCLDAADDQKIFSIMRDTSK